MKGLYLEQLASHKNVHWYIACRTYQKWVLSSYSVTKIVLTAWWRSWPYALLWMQEDVDGAYLLSETPVKKYTSSQNDDESKHYLQMEPSVHLGAAAAHSSVDSLPCAHQYDNFSTTHVHIFSTNSRGASLYRHDG